MEEKVQTETNRAEEEALRIERGLLKGERPVYLSMREVAKILGIAEKTLRGHIRKGRIRGYKIFGKVCIHRGDLEAFLKKCRVLVR